MSSPRIRMHPKPMIRHNKSVVESEIEISAIAKGDSAHREPGLYLRLKMKNGATQLVHIPEGEALRQIKLACGWIDGSLTDERLLTDIQFS